VTGLYAPGFPKGTRATVKDPTRETLVGSFHYGTHFVQPEMIVIMFWEHFVQPEMKVV